MVYLAQVAFATLVRVEGHPKRGELTRTRQLTQREDARIATHAQPHAQALISVQWDNGTCLQRVWACVGWWWLRRSATVLLRDVASARTSTWSWALDLGNQCPGNGAWNGAHVHTRPSMRTSIPWHHAT